MPPDYKFYRVGFTLTQEVYLSYVEGRIKGSTPNPFKGLEASSYSSSHFKARLKGEAILDTIHQEIHTIIWRLFQTFIKNHNALFPMPFSDLERSWTGSHLNFVGHGYIESKKLVTLYTQELLKFLSLEEILEILNSGIIKKDAVELAFNLLDGNLDNQDQPKLGLRDLRIADLWNADDLYSPQWHSEVDSRIAEIQAATVEQLKLVRYFSKIGFPAPEDYKASILGFENIIKNRDLLEKIGVLLLSVDEAGVYNIKILDRTALRLLIDNLSKHKIRHISENAITILNRLLASFEPSIVPRPAPTMNVIPAAYSHERMEG